MAKEEAQAIQGECDVVLVDHMQRLFEFADVDNNGTLDKDEFVKEIESIIPSSSLSQ